MLKDYRNNLEIVAREISTETNFYGEIINNKSDLATFAEKVQFPSHGIILKPAEKTTIKLLKTLLIMNLFPIM